MKAIALRNRLQSSPFPEHSALRLLVPEDQQVVADVLASVSGCALETATQRIRQVLESAQGPWLGQASFVVEEQGKVVGASLISHWKSFKAPRVEFLGVRPEFQHQGLGKLLLRASMWACYHDGYNRMTAELQPDQEAALHWLMQMGFKPFDVEDLD